MLQEYPGSEERWDWMSALAEVYLRLGIYERTMELCQQVLTWDSRDEYTHYVLGQYYYEINNVKEAEIHLREANATRIDGNVCLLLGKVLENQGQLNAALEQYQEVIWQKQRFADSQAKEACSRVGAVLAQLVNQHYGEEVIKFTKEIISSLPSKPIEPENFFFPASILEHFALQSHNQWLERPSRLVPIIEEILRLMIDIEQYVESLVPGDLKLNWETWQMIQDLRRQAYPLSYDLFSYLQGYWDEPANVGECLHDIRERMLADYWRLGIFESMPSLTITVKSDEPFIIRGVAAKIQALFRILIRKLLGFQTGQKLEIAVSIGTVQNTTGIISVQLCIPEHYAAHVRQMYTTRNPDADPDWLLIDYILDESNGKLKLINCSEKGIGLQLDLHEARLRKHQMLVREIVRFVCESPRPWKADEIIPSQIQAKIQRALGVKPKWTTQFPELLLLQFDEVGLSAAKKLSGCSGDVHSVKHMFLGGITELGVAIEDGLTPDKKDRFLTILKQEVRVCEDIKEFLVSLRPVKLKPKELIKLNLKELNNLVRSVAEERKSSMTALGVLLRLSVGDDSGTETYAIDADEGRIFSAISELIDNSIEAFEKRKRHRNTITIQTSLVIDKKRGVQALQLRYRDTAGGIPADVHRRLFTGRRVLSAKKGGSGYGLTFIHDVVRQHGGVFVFKSEHRKGTSFTFTFPLPPKGRGRDSRPSISVDHAKSTTLEDTAAEEKQEKTVRQPSQPITRKSLPEHLKADRKK